MAGGGGLDTVTLTVCEPVSPPASVTRAVIVCAPGFEMTVLALAPVATVVVPSSTHWMLELMLPCCTSVAEPESEKATPVVSAALFAGEAIVTVGAVFAGVLVVVGTMPVASTASIGTSAALAVVAVAAGALLSAAVYLVAVRPFLPAGDVIGWVAGGLAAGLLVRELLGLPFSSQAYALPDPLGGAGVLSLGGGVTVGRPCCSAPRNNGDISGSMVKSMTVMEGFR